MGLRAQDKAGMPPGDMHFVCVLSGTYWIEASGYGPNHAFYVESISSGSMDLLANNLVVGSSASISPIEVVFRKGAATLSGTVNIANSSHGALVCVIPPAVAAIETVDCPAGVDGVALGVSSLHPETNPAIAAKTSITHNSRGNASLRRRMPPSQANGISSTNPIPAAKTLCRCLNRRPAVPFAV